MNIYLLILATISVLCLISITGSLAAMAVGFRKIFKIWTAMRENFNSKVHDLTVDN